MAYNFNLKHLIYPPLCIHCQERIEEGRSLCPSCTAQLTLTTQAGRCPCCFSEIETFPCPTCSQAPVRLTRQVAAVEKKGPAHSLLSAAKRGDRSVFASLAALMCYQWLNFNMPLPDRVIPIPSSYWKRLRIGFDPAVFLAQAVGKIWDVDALSLLSYRWDKERFFQKGEISPSFYLKEQQRVTDKRPLLILLDFDQEFFLAAAQALQLGFPTHIYALAFSCGPL